MIKFEVIFNYLNNNKNSINIPNNPMKFIELQNKIKSEIYDFKIYNEDEKKELKKLKDKKDKEYVNEIDKIFTIKFLFNDSTEKIEFRVESDSKYLYVLSEFLKTQNINDINPKYITSIHNYNIINQETTLNENYIKDGDKILLYSLSHNKKNSNLEEDDKEIIKKFLDEYKANKLCLYQKIVKNNIKSIDNIPNYISIWDIEEIISFMLYRAKINTKGINILEHDHELVCCITNYSWKCNLCNKEYINQDEKFCCTI